MLDTAITDIAKARTEVVEIVNFQKAKLDAKEKQTNLVKVGDYMAYCPYCSSEVTLFGKPVKGNSAILKLSAGDDDGRYTCKECNSTYRLTLRSWLFLGILEFSIPGCFLHFADEIPAFILAFILNHVVIIIISYVLIASYIWWRYFAQLEAEY
ncbi:MAG: hypothetical protein ACYS17_03825 [Planctomycetota bacterium]